MTTLTVNVISFGGVSAVINSYSGAYVGAFGRADIERQRVQFAERFPNASVTTELRAETEVVAMVAAQNARTARGQCACWDIGAASQAAHGGGLSDNAEAYARWAE